MRAIANVKRICEEHLQGRYELEVIVFYQQPVLGKGEEIIAVLALSSMQPESVPDAVCLAVTNLTEQKRFGYRGQWGPGAQTCYF